MYSRIQLSRLVGRRLSQATSTPCRRGRPRWCQKNCRAMPYTPEQQSTNEAACASLDARARALDEATERLKIVEAEMTRRKQQRADGCFPCHARSVGKVMLRRAPPPRSGIVGVLETGAEVTVLEAVQLPEGGALRYSVRGPRLTGWGNADKFELMLAPEERADGEAAGGQCEEGLVSLVAGPGANLLLNGLAEAAAVEAATASAIEGAGSTGVDEARALLLWELIIAGQRRGMAAPAAAVDTASAAVELGALAQALGRLSAMHCLRAPHECTAWASAQESAPAPRPTTAPTESARKHAQQQAQRQAQEDAVVCRACKPQSESG